VHVIDYTPPPTIKAFIKDHKPGELFYDWIVGPVGSGKTTGLFFKLAYMAALQEPSRDGVRRSRAVVVRNTMPQLKDTTLVSWGYWFKDGEAGHWNATDKKFLLKFGDVECEVLFRPLDTPDDVARVLSLEISFAILDEFVQIPREIVDALSARLGRYKLPDGTLPTNWGMWGSSNTSTEDNWWYDYLHNSNDVDKIDIYDDPSNMRRAMLGIKQERNVKYFVQPSGLSLEAENIENLPGGRGYYANQIKGKSEAWVKQFVESEWGFSISGKAVVPTFKADMHLAKRGLIFNPNLPLIAGFDPGLAGSALVFGQETSHGVLNVLGECVQIGYGAERLITEVVKPYLRRRFPNAQLIIAPDPAANNRTQTDERTVVAAFKKHWPCVIETNNRLPLRLDAIEHFTTLLTEVGPALQIDALECPKVVRALKGGWRYEMNVVKGVVKGADPEKNEHSHPGDGFGYLCRYFHKLSEREQKMGGRGQKFVVPQFKNAYNFR